MLKVVCAPRARRRSEVTRTIALAVVVGIAASAPAVADKIHFKDGTVKVVEIYHESPTYVCFVHDGKLAGAARSTIERIEYEDEPVCDVRKVLKDRAAERAAKEKKAADEKLSAIDLMKKQAGELKGKQSDEEKKKAARIKLLEEAFKPRAGPLPSRGTTRLPAGQSKTGESEMIVDPFPEESRRRPRR